ncbi:DUF6904 family protein [Cupriavidus pampae]|uniref:Uncharacterized protein n=1 Tax=Cupriavidus pampae TaxID=659251 RepID=A0ABM8XUJ0_9BURK|nr:hypothetical protein [Cupriavidus pampae]CAG9184034.1 hypothetical protein LMG32289_05492 [Cupriavidus pampae]
MLMYDLLKNHAGILLCGDYKSLCSLHEVIHQVNEKSVLIKDKDGPFLGLAYDLRKAYEGQRRKFKAPAHYPEIGPSFGVEIIWPVILLQCSMLRAALAFFDCTKRHQAFTFALEDLVEAALIADFGANAPEIIANWQRIDPRMPWAEEKLSSRGAQFCQWSKAQRRVGLAGCWLVWTRFIRASIPNGPAKASNIWCPPRHWTLWPTPSGRIPTLNADVRCAGAS